MKKPSKSSGFRCQTRGFASAGFSFVALHPEDKIFCPEEKITNGDVIAYYDEISPYILGYLKDRPRVLNRQPDGAMTKGFYQKDTSRERLPAFLL